MSENNYSLSFETVTLDEDTKTLLILDQTLLPNECQMLRLSKLEDIWQAIYRLQVRGAPAIGVAGAIGLYVVANQIQTDQFDDFYRKFSRVKEYLATARPTAVNLVWALSRMDKIVFQNRDQSIPQIKELLLAEAKAIRAEDEQICHQIGEHGLTLLKDGDGILTHCNAGQLATSRYGTALAPIHLGKERGMRFHVYADETRPLLQGARLTAFELCADGIDTTLICDNMASTVMRQGKIQAVLVGCDRVAANGDTANKIGTSGVAILAKYYGIPFYVCAPTSTIDLNCPDGGKIPIEERPATEVTELWYAKRMAPKEVKVYNPAFDVTDASLITAFITEKGVIYPDYKDNFARLF